jgi:hypothetical protein
MALVTRAGKGAPLTGTDYDNNLAHFDRIVGSGRGLVPIEKFGVQMQTDPHERDIDQSAAFQQAVDSAAGSGDLILISRGRLCISRPILMPTISGLVGTHMYGSQIKLMNGSNCRMLEFNNPALDASGNGTGNMASIMTNLMINGNKFGNTTYKGSTILATTGDDDLWKQEKPFHETLNHLRAFIDPNRLFQDLYIVDACGIGMETSGRGSSTYRNIRMREPGIAGFRFASWDDFCDGLIVTAPGGPGIEIANPGGQSRFVNCKVYFTGADPERTDGDGWLCSGNVGSVALIACCAQDTHRHGFNLQGYSIIMEGCQAAEIGALRPVFGRGNTSVDPNVTAVRARNLIDSGGSLTVGFRMTKWSGTPSATRHLVDIGSGCRLNSFEVYASESDTNGREYVNEVRNDGAGRNWVRVNGRPSFGYAFTAAQLQSRSHPVNAQGKSAGMQVFDSTNNRPLWSSGAGAAAAWHTATGAAAISPT